jgi:hypothetical protein
MAMVDAPLLITGETGTGKELLAHACHAGSSRRSQPFFALNCAALPENLAESELFGYAAGAFTGALRGGKPGLLELADGGTVFLDEIGEMSPYLQAKLLRFLNDGSFRRVGGDREVRMNVRIISATHRALEDMVSSRPFPPGSALPPQCAQPAGSAPARTPGRHPAPGSRTADSGLRPSQPPPRTPEPNCLCRAADQPMGWQCSPAAKRDFPSGHHDGCQRD